MNPAIEKILADVYALEPELRAHEAVLISIIEELQKAKPDIKFDSNFARELKARVLAQPLPASSHRTSFSVKQSAFAFGGLAVALVLLLVVTVIKQTTTPKSSMHTVGIARLASGAFGPLTASQSVPAGDKAGAPMAAVANTAVGLGGGSAESTSRTVTAAAPVAFGMGGGGGGVASKIMYPYPYIRYTYSYSGDPLKLSDATLDVYKHVPPTIDTSGLLSALSPFTVNGLDTNSFPGSNVTSFEITQNTSDGYIINVNVGQGQASINQNWQTWQQENCSKGICQPLPQLTESDVPADDVVINLANAFLQAHHIDVSGYAAPEINNTWRLPMMKAADTNAPDAIVYIPDILTILYPQKVNGDVVYDMNGNKIGMSVSVDIRHHKVTGAWNITSYSYQASSYAAETDDKKIVSIAERGGLYGNMPYYEDGSKTQTISLGTPTRVLVTTWQNSDNGSSEIIVPALYFPIMNTSSLPYYFARGVTVPLAKELLNQGNDGPGIIQPMLEKTTPSVAPMMK